MTLKNVRFKKTTHPKLALNKSGLRFFAVLRTFAESNSKPNPNSDNFVLWYNRNRVFANLLFLLFLLSTSVEHFSAVFIAEVRRCLGMYYNIWRCVDIQKHFM